MKTRGLEVVEVVPVHHREQIQPSGLGNQKVDIRQGCRNHGQRRIGRQVPDRSISDGLDSGGDTGKRLVTGRNECSWRKHCGRNCCSFGDCPPQMGFMGLRPQDLG